MFFSLIKQSLGKTRGNREIKNSSRYELHLAKGKQICVRVLSRASRLGASRFVSLLSGIEDRRGLGGRICK